MRDILFVSICLGLLPVFLRRPWIGILGWYGTAYFVPQGISWGFARSFPFAMVVGSATLLGFLFTKDRKPLPRDAVTLFMLGCTLQFTLTTIVAYNQELAWVIWSRVMKMLLMTFVTMAFFQDRARLRWLYMVPALGLGFYGVKGLLWVLRTGGGGGGDIDAAGAASEGGRIFGPDMSFFSDANGMGLGLCMILPLLLYLSREEERWWLRYIFRIAFGASILAAIFTYSRGTFLGLAVVGLVLIWRSPWRLRFATALLVAGILAAPLAPERLWVRLGTISEQQSAETRDASTVGRIESFETAWHSAISNPFTGVGFRGLSTEAIWMMYYGPGFRGTFDPHSIYFEVLGEHGLLGFALYTGLIVSTLLTLRRLRKRWRNHPEHGYLSRYAEMTQLALYPFLVSGAFIPVAMFDLFFLLAATTSMLHVLSEQAECAEAAKAEAQRAEAARLAPPRRRPLAPRPTPAALPTRPRQRPRHV